LFTGEGHAPRACRAAAEMQQTMRGIGRLRTSAGLVTLRMSIGIHSAGFDFFLAGDLHRELIVAGPAATQTVLMESIADAGEIALSHATASLLPQNVLGRAKESAVLHKRAPPAPLERSAAVEHDGGLEPV